MGIVFVDIEGTVLSGNLTHGFISAGRRRKLFGREAFARSMVILLWAQVAPKARRPTARWDALLQLVKGHTREEIMATGRAGMPETRPQCKQQIVDRIAAHQAKGDTVILLSGGMAEAAEVIAEEVGADRGEGTRCQVRNGHYTGKLDGPICNGENKAARARQVSAELGASIGQCTAYGDSAADIPLLSAVSHAVAVDPDPELAAEAKRKGWEIITTPEGAAKKK